MIQPGEMAPDFTLPASGPAAEPDGKAAADTGMLRLSALRGRRVALYFYPRDATPACTTEAQDFSALAKDFAAEDAVIVGISKDTLRKHGSFRKRSEISVTLASDAESDTCERYGVWGEKQFMGRHFLGIIRSTFLIGADGKVLRVWSPVRVAGHAAEVLAALREAG